MIQALCFSYLDEMFMKNYFLIFSCIASSKLLTGFSFQWAKEIVDPEKGCAKALKKVV
jgi:hypothetical protein